MKASTTPEQLEQAHQARPDREQPEPFVVEADDDTPLGPPIEGSIALLKRGLAITPELRVGLAVTIVLALCLALGRVIVPILLQQVFDKGLTGESGFRSGYVALMSIVALSTVVVVAFGARITFWRMGRAAEDALRGLRVRTFAHIHELSLNTLSGKRRGQLVARVTSDVDALARFIEWPALAWISGTGVITGCTVVMAVYSWQLTLVVLVVMFPLYLVLRSMQRGLVSAYDDVRTRVGESAAAVAESVSGAAVVRAYGIEEHTRTNVRHTVERRYRAQIHANFFGATIFPISDLFGAAALAAVITIGTIFHEQFDLSLGRLVAFLFLVALFMEPLAEIAESFDMTQTALAGYRKILEVLDIPASPVEPAPGVPLPEGPLAVRTEGVQYAYDPTAQPVLREVDIVIPAGTHVAVVGETGSGKTTFAKLLVRLDDPTEGRVLVGDVDLAAVAPASRRASIRMVPQDGFLFDTSIRENVRHGRPGASDSHIQAAFAELGLVDWLERIPEGLDTPVGERGENLSVGERQLVALARAQLASPGLLILDEATSNVDPETERVLTEAMQRVGRGRTTVAIAHRLSTAEGADTVLVFDRGRVVEQGTHTELVAAAGVYAGLYESWLGNTQDERAT